MRQAAGFYLSCMLRDLYFVEWSGVKLVKVRLALSTENSLPHHYINEAGVSKFHLHLI